jgi:hypothetical protein
MTELVRGDVTDRPWGLTLGALALRGLTGTLVLESEGYAIAFHEGAVVHATSKDARDAAARIAVTNGLVKPSQAAEIVKRLAAKPDRDELATVIEVGKLDAGDSDRLRRRVIAQRTARTFSLAKGAFAIDDAKPADTQSAVDVRPIIYLGAHAHMSDERLTVALAGLGAFFRLKPEVKEDLARFGFTDAEREVTATLAGGASIADLEGAHPRVDRRSLLAIVYALVSALAVEIAEAAPQAMRSGRARTRGKLSVPPENVADVKVSFKPPRKTRRTDQLMAWVVVPREPAPRARPDTLDDAPLEEVQDAPVRPRTPTPFGPGITPRKPAKS